MARSPLTPFRSGSGLLGGGDPFLSLHREMNRLFDDVFRGMPAQGSATGGTFVNAHMNVSETDTEIRITAELPGVAEKDIDITLDDDILTIRGEKRFEQADDKESFHFVERSYGTFQRSLRLPFPVQPDQVQARFANGVLTLTLPKSAKQERARKIQLQGGSTQQGTGQSAASESSSESQTGSGQPSGRSASESQT